LVFSGFNTKRSKKVTSIIKIILMSYLGEYLSGI
jgi:hypothetical protein